MLHLADLRRDLRAFLAIRKAQGILVKDMGASVGRGKDFMALLNDEFRLPWDWYWSTFHSLATALDLVPIVEVKGPEIVPTPMYQIGQAQSIFMGVGVLELLKSEKDRLRLTYGDMGKQMRVVKSVVYKIETSNDPKLMSIMKFGRGVNRRVRFRVEEQ